MKYWWNKIIITLVSSILFKTCFVCECDTLTCKIVRRMMKMLNVLFVQRGSSLWSRFVSWFVIQFTRMFFLCFHLPLRRFSWLLPWATCLGRIRKEIFYIWIVFLIQSKTEAILAQISYFVLGRTSMEYDWNSNKIFIPSSLLITLVTRKDVCLRWMFQ